MTEVRLMFDQVQSALESAIPDAIQAACEYLLSKSDELVPLETGALMRSGGYDVSGEMGSVYYDTVYALRQHEELDWKHDGGRQAKYLEKAGTANAAKLGEIMGQAIATRMGDS